MTAALWFLVSSAGLVLGVCGAFLAVMNAKRMKREGSLTLFWAVVAAIWGLVGTVLDVVFQWSLGHMFLEPPPMKRERIEWLGREFDLPYPELLFSDRVQRQVDESPRGWRLRLALWWARQLNAGAPGHIRHVDAAIARQGSGGAA